jgi:hypothetical protein
MKEKPPVAPWWGYSKEHCWVVLDRSLSVNAPGPTLTLLFYRYRDASVYVEKRRNWNPPGYRFAPNYLSQLEPDAARFAADELEAFKGLFPEIQAQLRQALLEAASTP